MTAGSSGVRADRRVALVRLGGRFDASMAASQRRRRLRGPPRRTGLPPRLRAPAAFLLPALRPPGDGSAAHCGSLEESTALSGVESSRGGTCVSSTG